MKKSILVLSVFMLFSSLWATPQQRQRHQRQGQTSSVDSLKIQLKSLQDRFEKLEAERKKEKQKAQLDKLMQQAQVMSTAPKKEKKSGPQKFMSTARSQSALNPNVSLGGDFYLALGSSDSEYNSEPSEVSWGTGRFFLRELELGIEAPLDPFSRGKVFLSFGEEGVVLEEGYMQWLNLPLGMNLKMGMIKAQFGKLNRYHDHALPQFARPFVLYNFFGQGSLKGLGVGANFLLPSITAQVNELDLEVIHGGVGHCFTANGDRQLVYVGHYKNYFDLNRSTYLELGLSGALGKNDVAENYTSTVGGLDLTLRWAPPGRSKYRGIEWRSEALFSNRETPGDAINAWGFFSSLQTRLNARFLCSVRVDYSQLPWDSDLEEKGVTGALDFWQSEFVFMRFQYTYLHRNFDEKDHRFIVQTSWAMGPHKHEAY